MPSTLYKKTTPCNSPQKVYNEPWTIFGRATGGNGMREKQNFLFGCVCIALATLIFSTMEVVLKLPAVEGAFHPMQITLGRFLVGGICLLPVAGWALYRKKTKLTGKDLRSFALTGFF